MNWQVLLFILILIFVTIFLCVLTFKSKLLKKFDKIRCNPFYMPFVSIINPEVNTADNANYCSEKSALKAMPMHFADLKIGMKLQGKATDMLKTALSDITHGLQFLGSRLTSFFDSLKKRADEMAHTLNVMSLKIGSMLEKISAIIVMIFYFSMNFFNMTKLIVLIPSWIFVILYLIFGFLATMATSIIIGGLVPFFIAPVIAVGVAMMIIALTYLSLVIALQIQNNIAITNSYCCFSPDTLVVCKDGSLLKMEEISLGQQIGLDNYVLGKLIIHGDKTFSDYDGVYVSDNHYVQTAAGWMHAGKYASSSRTENRLVCLVTSNNEIVCQSGLSGRKHLFLDYEESHRLAYRITGVVLKSLGCNSGVFKKYEHGERTNALHSKDEIWMHDGQRVCVCDIQIGDCLLDGAHVVGIFETICEPDWLDMDGQAMNARQIYWNGCGWSKIYHAYSKKISKNRDKYIHLITTSGIIPLYHLVHKIVYIRDFLESTDICTNSEIDDLVLDVLKNNG